MIDDDDEYPALSGFKRVAAGGKVTPLEDRSSDPKEAGPFKGAPSCQEEDALHIARMMSRSKWRDVQRYGPAKQTPVPVWDGGSDPGRVATIDGKPTDLEAEVERLRREIADLEEQK